METIDLSSEGRPVGLSPSPGLIGKLAYLAMWAGILVLGVSGIGSFFTGRVPMHGWVLMAHVGCSGLFSVGLAVVAVTWSPSIARRGRINACLFWLLLMSGVVVILSGVLPMIPWLGTHGQHLAYLIHRYSAIATAGVAILHLLTCRAPKD